jgi:hypothetical protein
VIRPVSLPGFVLFGLWLAPAAVRAELPQGYLVWSRGTPDDPASRQIVRMTLPGLEDQQALTSGEDVEPRISPDGKWVAYAKAKFPGGSDYHDFTLWRPTVVSIHGAAAGRKEIKIDDDGAWPSWGGNGALFYNQADGTQSRIMRVELDEHGLVVRKQVWLTTKDVFPQYAELNECFVAPDESWFAGRTRGNATQNGVSAFVVTPPQSYLLAQSGSIGCMPFVAPGGAFAIIAGADLGIRWGASPLAANRKVDQLLIPPLSAGYLAYHPGISSDEKWVLAAQGTDTDHNAGRYNLYIHPLDTTSMTAGAGQALTSDGFNGWPHLWVGTPGPPPPPQPAVAEFYPSSYTVAPGETVTLTWSTFGADRVSLEGAPVLSDGTLDVSPVVTTSYTLSAQSSLVSDSDTRTLSIVVNPSPQPVSMDSFVANPPRITKGGSTVLSWQVSNATTLDLDGARTGPSGSREVSPLVTTTYVLTARGLGGPVQAQTTVVVDEPKSGLLPDRGGFVCALGSSDTGSAGGWLVALALTAMAIGRRRHPRRSR